MSQSVLRTHSIDIQLRTKGSISIELIFETPFSQFNSEKIYLYFTKFEIFIFLLLIFNKEIDLYETIDTT
jgi:hypothetical protein